MALLPIPSLVFTVRWREPELIVPAKPTPHIFKLLSDIDDQKGLRFQVPYIYFYGNNKVKNDDNDTDDPVQVIRDALAKTLVFYYPFAGRLRELAGQKLVVECTGEGVLFIEADADIRLDDFGDQLYPPFPCINELLFDVPGSCGVLDCPLLLIQITRLACGSFVFGLRINHVMSDSVGVKQFMTALSELAGGSCAPSILPVWQREFLIARGTQHLTCLHNEYDQGNYTKDTTLIPHSDLVQRSFYFGPAEIRSLRRVVPHHLQKCSTIEVITACLWRCRTRALQLDPKDKVCVIVTVGARATFDPPVPVGYYGNVFALPAALTTSGELCQNPMGYALELVRKIKGVVTEEYIRSVAEFMVMKERPYFARSATFILGDVTRVGLEEVDFGWGKAVCLQLAMARGDCRISFALRLKKKNECGILVPICLSSLAMEKFVMEIDSLLKGDYQNNRNCSPSKL